MENFWSRVAGHAKEKAVRVAEKGGIRPSWKNTLCKDIGSRFVGQLTEINQIFKNVTTKIDFRQKMLPDWLMSYSARL